MGASIIPSIGGAIQAQPDVTATAKPDISDQRSLYEILRDMYAQALDYRHGRTGDGTKYSTREIDRWIAQRMPAGMAVRTMKQLSRKLDELDRNGQRPISAEDLPWYARGALARVVRLGHGMSFGTSDRLAGLYTAVGERGPDETFGQAYKRGRNLQREALNTSSLSTNPGFDPAVVGGVASTVATAGAGGPMPTMMRSATLGGGFGLGGAVAAMPEITPSTLWENKGPLAANALLGGVLGSGIHYAAGELPMALRRPGNFRLGHELESLGEHQLAREVAASGVARPMLAELGGTEFSAIANEIRRGSRAGTKRALQAVTDELDNVRVAKAALDQQYGVLAQPVQNPRALQILSDPSVEPIVQRMIKRKIIRPGQQITGRVLEDARQLVSEEADRAFLGRFKSEGKQLRGLADELRDIIDGEIRGAPELRAQWRQIRDREGRLMKLEHRLNIPARGSKRLSPIKPTLHSAFLRALGREAGQISRREADQMVGPLFAPRTLEEHLSRLHGVEGVPGTPRFGSAAVAQGLPWYSQFAHVGPMVPGVLAQTGNPFFQMEPQAPQEQ